MDSARLLDRHPLENGLTLEFWDHSRPLVGGRRYVVLETRIAVAVRADTLPPDLKDQSTQVVKSLGTEIIFSKKEERNFIEASLAPQFLQEMQDRILTLAAAYFGHPDFAPRFIRKTFADLAKR